MLQRMTFVLLSCLIALSTASKFSGSLNAGASGSGPTLSLNQASYTTLLQQQQVTSDQALCGMSCMLLIVEIIASGSGLQPNIQVNGTSLAWTQSDVFDSDNSVGVYLAKGIGFGDYPLSLSNTNNKSITYTGNVYFTYELQFGVLQSESKIFTDTLTIAENGAVIVSFSISNSSTDHQVFYVHTSAVTDGPLPIPQCVPPFQDTPMVQKSRYPNPLSYQQPNSCDDDFAGKTWCWVPKPYPSSDNEQWYVMLKNCYAQPYQLSLELYETEVYDLSTTSTVGFTVYPAQSSVVVFRGTNQQYGILNVTMTVNGGVVDSGIMIRKTDMPTPAFYLTPPTVLMGTNQFALHYSPAIYYISIPNKNIPGGASIQVAANTNVMQYTTVGDTGITTAQAFVQPNQWQYFMVKMEEATERALYMEVWFDGSTIPPPSLQFGFWSNDGAMYKWDTVDKTTDGKYVCWFYSVLTTGYWIMAVNNVGSVTSNVTVYSYIAERETLQMVNDEKLVLDPLQWHLFAFMMDESAIQNNHLAMVITDAGSGGPPVNVESYVSTVGCPTRALHDSWFSSSGTSKFDMYLEPGNEYCIGLYNSDTGSETRVRAYITISPSSSDSSGMSAWAIVAIVAVSIAGIALLVVGFLAYRVRSRTTAAMPTAYNQLQTSLLSTDG